MEFIYLDNSATTKPSRLAVAAATRAMTDTFGNPSSLYMPGLEAENIITEARQRLAKLLSVKEKEIYFTSSGSESNNTAIFGTVKLKARFGKHIVTTSVEHASVLEPIRYLEKEGYEVTYIKPDEKGNIAIEKIADAIRSDTILVSVMYVNNETGAILPIEGIKKAITNKKSNALFHTDCVQALGKININLAKIDADLATFSSHKIHGLKGTGALFLKRGINLPPLIMGGGQEMGLRSGTENVPGIAAFDAALSEIGDINAKGKVIAELKAYCVNRLTEFTNTEINSPENGLPYILNFSFKGYRSETLLHFLEGSNVYVSSGSACSKGKGSYVLNEMGLSRSRVDSALRISFCKDSKKEDIELLITALKGTKFLKKSS